MQLSTDNHPSVREKDHTTGKPTSAGNNPPQKDTSEPPPQPSTNTDPKPPPKVSLEYSIDKILSETGRDADDLLTFAYIKSIVQGPGSDDNLGADDFFWVEAWKEFIALPFSLYKVPDSSVGKRLTQVLTTELRNVRLLKNTSGKLPVFILVILHRVRGITSYCTSTESLGGWRT